MQPDYDVIILGLGAMGSAAADQLSRRGLRVLGLEQFDIPHALGSSHGASRMIRMAYFEHPDYVPLLRRAYELWHDLEKRSQQKLLHLTGGIYFGPPDCELVAGSLSAAREHRLEHRLLSHDAVTHEFPMFDIPANYVALHEPMAGFLEPEKCIAALARLALQQGGDLRGRVVVRSWSADHDGVRVTTDDQTFRARKLLVTAGAWTSQLIQDLGVPLVVTRQTLAWFWPSKPEPFTLGQFPVWALHRPAGGIYYGFPMMADPPGLKVAIHARGQETNPDTVDRALIPGELDELQQMLRDHLPDGSGPLLSHKVCLYTNSPDEHFILDRLPHHDNVLVAAGFSGHGFKFASVIGEALADLTEHDRTALPIDFLSLKRFPNALGACSLGPSR